MKRFIRLTIANRAAAKIVFIYFILILISIIQNFYLKCRQKLKLVTKVRKVYTQVYQPQIFYNRIARFTFVGLGDMLCYHFTRFTPQEIFCIFLLLCLKKICFCNCLEAIPEEALAVILIQLSYSIPH